MSVSGSWTAISPCGGTSAEDGARLEPHVTLGQFLESLQFQPPTSTVNLNVDEPVFVKVSFGNTSYGARQMIATIVAGSSKCQTECNAVAFDRILSGPYPTVKTTVEALERLVRLVPPHVAVCIGTSAMSLMRASTEARRGADIVIEPQPNTGAATLSHTALNPWYEIDQALKRANDGRWSPAMLETYLIESIGTARLAFLSESNSLVYQGPDGVWYGSKTAVWERYSRMTPLLASEREFNELFVAREPTNPLLGNLRIRVCALPAEVMEAEFGREPSVVQRLLRKYGFVVGGAAAEKPALPQQTPPACAACEKSASQSS